MYIKLFIIMHITLLYIEKTTYIENLGLENLIKRQAY